MANRINGNIVIVDSAMGNNFILTSANMVRNIASYKVQTISFFRLSTLASLILTTVNTSTDVVFSCNLLAFGLNSSGTVFVENPQTINFPLGLKVSEMKVPTITAGTAYLYLA